VLDIGLEEGINLRWLWYSFRVSILLVLDIGLEDGPTVFTLNKLLVSILLVLDIGLEASLSLSFSLS
jgi:hypothetical protein